MKGQAGRSHRIIQRVQCLRARNRNLESYLLILKTRKLKVEWINSIKVSSREENTG